MAQVDRGCINRSIKKDFELTFYSACEKKIEYSGSPNDLIAYVK